MKDFVKLLRAASMLGQLSFTIITPPVAMSLLGWWLQSRVGLGFWVMPVCLVIGLLTAVSGTVRFHRRLMKPKQPQSDQPVNFSRHE